jgi:hypothetical protein
MMSRIAVIVILLLALGCGAAWAEPPAALPDRHGGKQAWTQAYQPALIATETCRFGEVQPIGPGADCHVMIMVKSWWPAMLRASITPLVNSQASSVQPSADELPAEYALVAPDGQKVIVIPGHPAELLLIPQKSDSITAVRLEGHVHSWLGPAGVYTGALTLSVTPAPRKINKTTGEEPLP